MVALKSTERPPCFRRSRRNRRVSPTWQQAHWYIALTQHSQVMALAVLARRHALLQGVSCNQDPKAPPEQPVLPAMGQVCAKAPTTGLYGGRTLLVSHRPSYKVHTRRLLPTKICPCNANVLAEQHVECGVRRIEGQAFQKPRCGSHGFRTGSCGGLPIESWPMAATIVRRMASVPADGLTPSATASMRQQRS